MRFLPPSGSSCVRNTPRLQAHAALYKTGPCTGYGFPLLWVCEYYSLTRRSTGQESAQDRSRDGYDSDWHGSRLSGKGGCGGRGSRPETPGTRGVGAQLRTVPVQGRQAHVETGGSVCPLLIFLTRMCWSTPTTPPIRGSNVSHRIWCGGRSGERW